jgi:hypothetical protein
VVTNDDDVFADERDVPRCDSVPVPNPMAGFTLKESQVLACPVRPHDWRQPGNKPRVSECTRTKPAIENVESIKATRR